jgi:5-formyltetrahydrofolate cyclo-ligase
MKMLRLYSEEDLARCPFDKWGILDPGTHRRESGKEQEPREDGTYTQLVDPHAHKQ